MLAVKICKSLKMLAQLLCALGSRSKELSHCKGLSSCALSLLLVKVAKCMCSTQTQVLSPLLRGTHSKGCVGAGCDS